MRILAQTKYLRISPRKLRLVAEVIKHLPPLEAIEKLRFLNKKGSSMLISVLRQGIGNAKNNFKIEPENLLIEEILVEEGPRLKRIDKSHGARFDRGIKQKRLSHLKIYLKEKEAIKKPELKVTETVAVQEKKTQKTLNKTEKDLSFSREEKKGKKNLENKEILKEKTLFKKKTKKVKSKNK